MCDQVERQKCRDIPREVCDQVGHPDDDDDDDDNDDDNDDDDDDWWEAG